MFDKKIFCERLKTIRKEKSIPAIVFAKDIGVGKQTVSGWENAYRLPSLETIYDIADYFDVSVDYLLGRTDNPSVNK